MAKTLANLRTGCRVYLDESNQKDFLDTEVDRSINYAYHDVISYVIEVFEEFYDTTTPYKYALVADQQEYSINTGLIKVTRVEVNFKPTTSNSKPVRAMPIKKDTVLTDLAHENTSVSFFNAAYYLHGNIGSQKLGLVPIPDVSDTTGTSLWVWGVDLPSDLSASTDNVNVPYADNYAQLVELKAASLLLSKGQQAETAAANYLERYRDGIRRYQTFLKERQAVSAWMIEDLVNEDINFGWPGF